ncbi:MAG: hypothetical protein U0641_14445 [Anaerolineae bacterium]
MYAVNHAATALVIKKYNRSVPLVWLLLAVQAVEVLWVVFNYLGLEHITVENGVMHLGFLPYSHSIVTGLGLALITWLIFAYGLRQPAVGLALAIGIASHIFLDLIMHPADIALAPLPNSPVVGLGVYDIPLLAFAVETMYGIACWWIYRGSMALLAAIVILNLLDIPLIFGGSFPSTMSLREVDLIVTTVVAIQILLSWFVIWFFSYERHEGVRTISPSVAR